MPRKGPAPRRELNPDPVYRSVLVTQLVNKILLRGKRSLAEKIVYDAMKLVEERTGSEPLSTVKRAVENVKPALEVRSRRVGGATYQVPVEVRPRRPTPSPSAGSSASPGPAGRRPWPSASPASCWTRRTASGPP